MTRIVPAVVAVFLMLVFLAANQAILSTQMQKDSEKQASSIITSSSAAKPVPIDNDQRGAHSYFLSPRVVSARHHTNSSLIANKSEESLDNSLNDAQTLSLRANAQDLLRSGYLPDNEAVYTPDFGAAGKD